MSNIETGYSTNKDVVSAFRESIRSIDKESNLVLFYASTCYDFHNLTKLFNEHFLKAEVVGVTTSGEISNKGFLESSLVVMGFDNTYKAKAVMMSDIDKYPILSRDNLISGMKEIGLNPDNQSSYKEGFALVFPTGLTMAEEKMLSIVNSVFKYDGFPIMGGTAGDDVKFQETLISVNGVVSNNSGAVVFVKTFHKFKIYKENIFKSKGITLKVSEVDLENRIVKKLNGNRASAEYAKALGIQEKELPNYFMTNPIGRRVGDNIWIASPFQVLPDGSIQFYCQIFPHSTLELLEPEDPVAMIDLTIAKVKDDFKDIYGVISINCILRKLQFQSQKNIGAVGSKLCSLPNVTGFVSYGEQLGKLQLNQTLVLFVIGK